MIFIILKAALRAYTDRNIFELYVMRKIQTVTALIMLQQICEHLECAHLDKKISLREINIHRIYFQFCTKFIILGPRLPVIFHKITKR